MFTNEPIEEGDGERNIGIRIKAMPSFNISLAKITGNSNRDKKKYKNSYKDIISDSLLL